MINHRLSLINHHNQIQFRFVVQVNVPFQFQNRAPIVLVINRIGNKESSYKIKMIFNNILYL